MICYCLGRGCVRCSLSGLDALIHVLHLPVDFGYLPGTGKHFFIDPRGQAAAVSLVADIVLQTGPEVHGDGTDLDLGQHLLCPVRR